MTRGGVLEESFGGLDCFEGDMPCQSVHETPRPAVPSLIVAVAIAVTMACESAVTPTQPSVVGNSPELTEVIQGSFGAGSTGQKRWVDSRFYTIPRDGVLSVRITFLGDYSDLLWIEVWDGERRLGQVIARGYVGPKERLDVAVRSGVTYEVRLWTDKCCTRYEGFIVRPQ